MRFYHLFLIVNLWIALSKERSLYLKRVGRTKRDGYDWLYDRYKEIFFMETQLHGLAIDHITVSGFSSGGFLVSNLLAMLPEMIDGAAIIAGSGPCSMIENHQYCKQNYRINRDEFQM